jgi:hypothetical protein
MGAKENLVGNIKSIMHVPGRVMLGDIKGFKIIIIQLYLRSLSEAEAEGGKDFNHSLGNLGDRMFCPQGDAATRERDINALLRKAFILVFSDESFNCLSNPLL